VVGKPLLVDGAGRRGRELAVEVPVRYPESRVAAKSRSKAHTAEVNVDATVGGRRITPVPEPDARAGSTPPGGAVTLRHHFFFSPGDAARVRSAVSRGERPQLRIRAKHALAGGAESAGQTTSRTVPVKPVSPQQAQRSQTNQGPVRNEAAPHLGDADDGEGNNPCDEIDADPCVNAKGKVWEASGFWHSNSQRVTCPSGYLVAFDSDDYENFFEVDTKSPHWTSTSAPASANSLRVLMTDDNVKGHPIAYTPYVACTSNGGVGAQRKAGLKSGTRTIDIELINKTGADIAVSQAMVLNGSVTTESPSVPVTLPDEGKLEFNSRGAQNCGSSCLAAGIFVNPAGGAASVSTAQAKQFTLGALEPGAARRVQPPAALTLLAMNPKGAPSGSCFIEEASSKGFAVYPDDNGIAGLDYSVQWILRAGTGGPYYNGCD